MKKMFIGFLAVVSIVGCKPATSRKSSSPDTAPKIGDLSAPEKKSDLSVSEKTVGNRICTALALKTAKMSALTDKAEKFTFSGQWKACNEAMVSLAPYTSAISTSAPTLRYVPEVETTKSFQDVVTNESDGIKIFCTELKAANAVPNYTNLIDGTYYMIKLYNLSGNDFYELSKYSKVTSSGVFGIINIQVVNVITTINTTVDQKYAGIEKSRTLNSKCANPLDFTGLTQTWLSATDTY